MKRQSRRTLCAAGLITAALASGAFAQQQEETPTIKGRGKLSRVGLVISSALPTLHSRVGPNTSCLHPSSIARGGSFFGQGPQPPLGTCSSAPKICSLKPRKWQVPKEMLGRRLSQEEAKRLLAKLA